MPRGRASERIKHMKIDKDSVVSIDYIMEDEDGQTLENTIETGPSEFLMGHSQLMPAIEKALVEDFNQIILEEWCKQWESSIQLNPSIIGTESTGKFLQTSPADAMMLVLSMEASFGDVSGPMRIAVPYYTLEPVVSRLLATTVSKEEKQSVPPRWHNVYDEIPVAVSAEWDAFQLSLRDLSNLEVDDVIEMSPSLVEDTKLRIENRTCFIGEIGLEGDQVAFQVNESIAEAVKLIGKNHG